MAGSPQIFWASRWRSPRRPGSFKTKKKSKLGALELYFAAKPLPESVRQDSPQVRINYYPPRGDNKEGWDNIDIFGWLGYPMQIKVDFLCRDSILARQSSSISLYFRSRETRRQCAVNPGMAKLLFQVPHVRQRTLPGARPLHSVHEAEEHPALDDGRRPNHPPRRRVLRLALFAQKFRENSSDGLVCTARLPR